VKDGLGLHIPEDGILLSRRRGNLKSYLTQNSVIRQFDFTREPSDFFTRARDPTNITVHQDAQLKSILLTYINIRNYLVRLCTVLQSGADGMRAGAASLYDIHEAQ
jgi:hypothetical protein